MNKINKVYCIILLLSLLVSCKNNNDSDNREFPDKIAQVKITNKINNTNNEPTKIIVDLDNVVKGNFNDFFILKKIIYLNDDSPIGQITKLEEYKDRIIILDRENAKQLFCFTHSGDLIWEYKSQGAGPLEYSKISDFVVNENSNTIDVLDENNHKIIKINIDTGKPIEEFKTGVYAREMVMYNSNEYLMYTMNLTINDDLSYKLLLINSNAEVISRNLKVSNNDKKRHWTGFRSLDKFDKKVFFTETLNDTIYSIENDTIKERILH